MSTENSGISPQTMSTENSGISPQTISIASHTRLPEFSFADPALWFIQVESAFAADRITSQVTKYHKVIATLPLEVIKVVSDITAADDKPYTAVQKRILTTYGDSDFKKLESLLTTSVAGPQKPSLLLASLRYKATTAVSDDLLRVIWNRQLPQRIRELLATMEDTDLETLAATADRIFEQTPNTVNAVNDPTNQLQAQIDKLQRQIDHLSQRSRSQSPQRNKKSQQDTYCSHSPQSHSNRKPSPIRPTLCFYHEKWGLNARKCQKPCSHQGKRRRVANQAGLTTPPPANRLFIQCEKSKIPFLIDSGAQVSILPNSVLKRTNPQHGALVAANDSPLTTYGTTQANLQLDGQTFPWTFTVADIPQAILGADFLAHYGMLVDLRHQKLILSSTQQSLPAYTAALVRPLSAAQQIAMYKPAIVHRDPGMHHYIETRGPPVHAKARPLPPDKLKAVKAEFATLLKAGIIEPSKSPWSSPLHVVTKSDGTLRPCGDYRQLNARTIPDAYSVPHLHSFNTLLHGTAIYTTLDIKKAFHHIPIAAEDIPKTAIITPFGLYQYRRMGFGLRNAAQTWQRFMDHILQGLPYVFAYLDDVLVASRNIQQHEVHLQEVLKRFAENGLELNKPN